MQQMFVLDPADQPRVTNKCLQLEKSSTLALLCAMENACKRGKKYLLSGDPLTLGQRRWSGTTVAFAFTVKAVG